MRELIAVLDGWKAAIENRGAVADLFTEDALFQGLRSTHSLGRAGVAEYYASQPLGLTADYRILEARRVAEEVIVGYVSVDFGFADRPTLSVHLTVVLQRGPAAWLISHYHVSKIEG